MAKALVLWLAEIWPKLRAVWHLLRGGGGAGGGGLPSPWIPGISEGYLSQAPDSVIVNFQKKIMAEIVSFSLSLPLCHPQCGAKTRLLHLPSVKIHLNPMELLTQNEAARVASVKTAVSTFTVLTYHSPQIIWEKVPLKPYDHSAEWRGAQILTATFQGAMMALWGLFGDLGHTSGLSDN